MNEMSPTQPMPPIGTGEAQLLLDVQGLAKRFGGLVAAHDISFKISSGEILGLIGPNGSGKTTVMRLIMGLSRPDAGAVFVDGVNVAGWPAHRIARQGVGIVFQHSRPLQRQTVLENIMLALLPDSLLKLLADRHVMDRAKEIAERVGLNHVLHRRPSTLPFADLRRLELAKAIARNPRVVLVDEPFAGLTSGEVATFSDLIASFRADGHAVLLVDHNVKSVAALVDRVFAMYLGERIAEGTAEEVTRDPTVRRVYLGGGLDVATRAPRSTRSQALLEVEKVNVFYGKAQALEDVSIRVEEGEFVSIVGLNGAGKTSLFNAISGLVAHSGTITWEGRRLAGQTPAAIARGGIVQCPETRELFGEMTVRENLDLAGQHLPTAEAARQLDWLYDLFPRLRDRARQAARTMSGGEQQMLAIARSLMMRPKLLMLDEPTLGLAPVILEQISKALEVLRNSTPITVLLSEQNVTFALPHADRIYVLDHARITWEGNPSRFAQEAGIDYL
jgi:branched-chain amino acid transport system ATP-binding protein